MAIIYLALGSNVGNGDTQFDNAISRLQANIDDIVQAPRYRSKAVGYTNQPDFLNTVISGQTNLSPQNLLVFIKKVEQAVGRIERFRWGPREIDIDIIFYDDAIINEPSLCIPHPRFAERDFVLKPLSDLAPDLVDPTSKQAVKALYHNLAEDSASITK